MATSGTYSFSMNNTQVVEEAYELAGYEGRTAQHAITARRSLELIFNDWTNRGVNLWCIEEITTDMVDGTASYTLTARTFDVLSAVMRDQDQSPALDIPMERISMEEYQMLPDKTTEGQPNQWMLLRGQSTPTLYVYPTPDDSDLDFVAWHIRYMADIGTAVQDPDVPRSFLPALIYRLAFELAMKRDVNSMIQGRSEDESRAILAIERQRRADLKMISDDLFNSAKEGNTDAADLILRPMAY